MDFIKGKKMMCTNCGQEHGEKEACKIQLNPEMHEIKEQINKPAREEKPMMPRHMEEYDQEPQPTRRVPPRPQEIVEEVSKEDKYWFVEKREILDKNTNNVYWNYNCKCCGSPLLNIPFKNLEFIQAIEERDE